MENLKVTERCIGCGACFTEYPDILQMNDDGYACVIPEKEKVEESVAEEIKAICPVEAIISNPVEEK